MLPYRMGYNLGQAVFLQQSVIEPRLSVGTMERPTQLPNEPYYGQSHVCRGDPPPNIPISIGGKHLISATRIHAED